MMQRCGRSVSFFAAGAAALLLLAGCGGDDAAAPVEAVTVTVTETVNATVTVTAEPTPEAEPSTDPAATDEPSSAPESGSDFGPYATPADAGVSVVDSGWTITNSFGWVADYGVVLYNNGPATNATVTLQGIHDSQVVSSTEEEFSHVPANSWFVAGGALTDLKGKSDTIEISVNTDAAGAADVIDVSLTVEAPAPAGRRYQNVPVTITNSGTDTMQADSTIHVVVLDANGQIFTGGSSFTSLPIPGGQSVRDVVADVDMHDGGATTALAYVDLLNADPLFN